MNTIQIKTLEWLSLISIIITVILGSIGYCAFLGDHIIRAAMIGIVILFILMMVVLRTQSRIVLSLYGLINAFIIVRFGFIDGFWNHVFKFFLFKLHNGMLPPMLAPLFSNPLIGSAGTEMIWGLTFVASLLATYFAILIIQSRHKKGENDDLL